MVGLSTGDKRRSSYLTYPANLKAVMALCCSDLRTLNVTNPHRAVSSFGVLSAFQVLSVIFPSGDPVARTPRREYSRSWKARELIVGGTCGSVAEKSRSILAMGLALTVCRHSFCREHVAMYPCLACHVTRSYKTKRKRRTVLSLMAAR